MECMYCKCRLAEGMTSCPECGTPIALRYTLRCHARDVIGVAFSPDSRTLASGSWDGTVKIWSVESAKELATLKGHGDKVHCVAFGPGQTAKLEEDGAAWEPMAMG